MSRSRLPQTLRALVEAQTTGREEQAKNKPQEGRTGPRARKLTTEPRASAGVAVRRAYADALPAVLVLDGYPSSEQADVLGPNGTTRRWNVAAARKHIHDWVKVEADRQQVGAVAAPVRVTYTFVVPDRIRRDWDNYAGICKPVQDGLVLCGVLPGGDHWQALEGNVRFRVEPSQRRLEVVIEALGGAS